MTIREIYLPAIDDVLRYAALRLPSRLAVERRVEDGWAAYRIVCDDGVAPSVRVSCLPPGYGWRALSDRFVREEPIEGSAPESFVFRSGTEEALRALGADPAEAVRLLRAARRSQMVKVAAAPGSRFAEVEISWSAHRTVGHDVQIYVKSDVESCARRHDAAFEAAGYAVFRVVGG